MGPGGSIFILGDDDDGESPGGPVLVTLITRLALDELRPEFLAFLFGGYPRFSIPFDASDLHLDPGFIPDI